MATIKRDYEYDINEKLLLQTAFTELVDNERSAFWWAIGAGILTTSALKKYSGFQPLSRFYLYNMNRRKFIGLISTTTSYSFLTY